MREVVIPLLEFQFIPLNEHPAPAGTGALNIDAPPINLCVLVIPLTSRIIVKVQRHIYAVVFFHHLAESHLCYFSYEIVAGDFAFRARFCSVLAKLNSLLIWRTPF